MEQLPSPNAASPNELLEPASWTCGEAHVPYFGEEDELALRAQAEALAELCAKQAAQLECLEQELVKVQANDSRLQQELLEARAQSERERLEYDAKLDQMARLQARLLGENEQLFAELECAVQRIEALKREMHALEERRAEGREADGGTTPPAPAQPVRPARLSRAPSRKGLGAATATVGAARGPRLLMGEPVVRAACPSGGGVRVASLAGPPREGPC
uniref:Uncharacterized protein n=1 Tax=Alexandrium monilatum TaxID=311494 RepID=A0A7S4RZE3_9DINO